MGNKELYVFLLLIGACRFEIGDYPFGKRRDSSGGVKEGLKKGSEGGKLSGMENNLVKSKDLGSKEDVKSKEYI
ncbi:MAG TPA: hypothetical protein VIL83_05540 [Capillibacterium sp.]